MGQSPAPRRRRRARPRDHQRADPRPLGDRQGRRRRQATAASSASARPATPTSWPGVTRIVIGAATEVIAGEGLILTAGGIDCHVHFICPQQIDEALARGHHHDHRRRHRAGRRHQGDHLHARRLAPRADAARPPTRFPVNIGLLGKGNTSLPAALVRADPRRRVGLKLHEDWGTTPAAIDCCLRGRRRATTCRSRSTPTRSTSRASSRTRSPRSRAGRSTPTTPRAPAAGTRPTSSRSCGEPNVLPSSTNPTRPYTRQHPRRAPRHAHGLPPPRPGDPRGPGVRREPHPRARPSPPRTCCTTSARSRMISSRLPGDGPRRRGHPAHLADRAQDEGAARRARRATRRATTTSASGATSPSTRSTRRSRTASRTRSARSRSASSPTSCCGGPAFFGVKPELVLKGGIDRLGADGRRQRVDPDAAAGAARGRCSARSARRGRGDSLAFVSQARAGRRAACRALRPRASARRRCAACRGLGKRDMVLNDALPRIEVDPETYEVRADGELLTCEPAQVLPMAQRYFLF